MKRNLKISLCILVVILVVIGIFWSNIHRANSLVRGLEVSIEYDGCDTLVSSDDIKNLIYQQLPHLQTQLVKEVDKERVLLAVNKSPYMQQCNVNVSVGRKIVVRGLQRCPVVRVFYDTAEFYMDSLGMIMPLSVYSNIDVIVANSDCKDKKILKTICQLSTYLYKHEEYNNLFDQIYIDKKEDIYLVPKIGNHIVLLGDMSNIDQKMKNLVVMYHKGMKKTGWDTYEVINLKYKNQVICRKRK